MKKLLAFDFDGTCFDTFRPSPNSVDVNTAVRRTLVDMFGEGILLTYTAMGGLQNRSPGELIIELARECVDTPAFFASAKRFFRGRNARTFNCLVPAGKGMKIDWLSLHLSTTELFVRRKLEILLCEISSKRSVGEWWPKPTTGFIDFWNEISVDDCYTAIVSSGHDMFIERTFALYDLPCPDIMMTDDDQRAKMRSDPFTSQDPLDLPLHKPNPLMIEELRRKFEESCGGECEITFFGDCPDKDGGLAEAAGIPFYLFGEKESDYATVVFTDWRELLTPA